MVQVSQAAWTMVSSLLSKAGAWMPMEWARSLSGASLVLPYYHIVSDANVPHVSHLYRFRTVAEFKADIEFLLRHFESVALGEVVDALNGGRTWKRSSFHLTFDDGFREIYDVVAPILQQAGVHATFFVNTAYLNGDGLAHYNALSVVLDRLESRRSRMSTARLRQVDSLLPPAKGGRATLRGRLLAVGYGQDRLVRSLAEACDVDLEEYVHETRPHLTYDQVMTLIGRGFTVGGHGHEHLLYRDLPLSQQLVQTRINMKILGRRFGVSPRAFAFPHNDDGVEDTFFSAVFSERLLDISFGTGGLVPHFQPRNLQRISMEKTSAPAARILARQFSRATYFRLRQHRLETSRRSFAIVVPPSRRKNRGTVTTGRDAYAWKGGGSGQP